MIYWRVNKFSTLSSRSAYFVSAKVFQASDSSFQPILNFRGDGFYSPGTRLVRDCDSTLPYYTWLEDVEANVIKTFQFLRSIDKNLRRMDGLRTDRDLNQKNLHVSKEICISKEEYHYQ